MYLKLKHSTYRHTQTQELTPGARACVHTHIHTHKYTVEYKQIWLKVHY